MLTLSSLKLESPSPSLYLLAYQDFSLVFFLAFFFFFSLLESMETYELSPITFLIILDFPHL